MDETKEEQEKRLQRELEGKNIAYYSVLLNAWIQTRMERDKTLVTLSAAAVGLLVTLLTTVGINKQWVIFLYLGAFIGFSLTIFTSLKIYQKNSEHIEEQIKEPSGNDPQLEKYDKLSRFSFYGGVIFSASIGIVTAINKFF